MAFASCARPSSRLSGESHDHQGQIAGGPKQLGNYLAEPGENENIQVIDVRGTVADDPRGAVLEMDAHAAGTRCEKPLYHAFINPEPPYSLSTEQISEAVEALEAKLGFDGHARLVVLHEKHGRQHLHVVWSRIDLDRMVAVSDSHNYRKHEETARDLERRFGHPHVQGVHHERDGVERPERTPSRAELRQEERTGIRGKDVREEVTALFKASDGAEAFKAALEDKDYILAQGDARVFVIVDRAGGIHSLARRIEGTNTAELRKFMAGIDLQSLPRADQAKEMQTSRAFGNESVAYREKWDKSLDEAAIQKAKEEQRQKKILNWRAKLARNDALKIAAYARADGFGVQVSAANRDHKHRRKDHLPHPTHPDDHIAPTAQNKFAAEAEAASKKKPLTDATPEQDVPQGIIPKEPKRDHNAEQDQSHAGMEHILYGSEGHEKSERQRQTIEKDAKERDVFMRKGERTAAKESPEVPLGPIPNEPKRDYNSEQDRTRAGMEHNLYGSEGHEKSERRRQAIEQDTKERERLAREQEAKKNDDRASGFTNQSRITERCPRALSPDAAAFECGEEGS